MCDTKKVEYSETLMEMMDDAVNAPGELNRSLGVKMRLLSPEETVILQNFLSETFDRQVDLLHAAARRAL